MVRKLFAYCAHASVAQMVDIIHSCLGVDELDEIFDDLDDVVVGENSDILTCGEVKFLVETISSHVSKIVSLL